MINSILEPIKGVSNIMINVPVKTVYVDHDPRFVLATDLENVLNKGKFGATLLQDGGTTIATSSAGRSHFFVDKICCASEIPAILSIVEPLPGVSKVSISVTTKMVYVNHTTKVITANEICDALNNDAFGAHIKHDAADDMKDTLSVVVASTLIYDEELKDEKAVRSLLQEMDSFKVYEYVLDTSAKKIRVSHNPNFVTAESLVQDLVQALGLKTTILTDGVDNMKWIIPDIKEEEVPEEEMVRPNPYVVFSGIFWIISMLSFIGGNWDYLKYVGCISVAFGIPTIASKAFRTLRRYQFDANCMMLFATLGALGLQEFVEAAAITFLFSISEWLEVRATTRARMALSEIVNLRPDRANLVHPVTKEIVEVPAAAVPVGALVSVKFGDKIPCDGVVFEGQSTVNESSLTGESRPVPKGVNASVSGGTINTGTTALMIRTTCTVENSAVARLIRLVEEAQANRSPTEKLVDEFARRYTPVVILAALCMVTIPWAVSKEMGRLWTHNGLVLIIVACPCALIISTPVSYVAGLAATAQRGIIIKGGAHLEALGLVKKIAFDKTGTLTKGDFALLHLDVVGENRTREEVLQHLSKMEETAAHPLSQALVAAAKNEEVNIPKTMRLSNHVHLDGEGVTAQVNGKEVYVGNERLFRRLGLFDSLPTDKQKTVEEWTSLGGTIGYMSIEGDGIVCAYCVADAIRPEAAEVVAELQKLNIDCQMLTGDRKEAALKIGSMIGLSEEHVMSQLLPEDKLRLVEEMKKENGSSGGSVLTSCGRTAELVLFCGDGVNDAPAMATADIGVAMGAGAALAMETSDVTLLDSHLTKLVYSITMGRRVIRKIKENVIFSLAAKAIVVGFALVGKVDLWAAIATDVGAMLIVTLNGMLLLPASKKASKPSLENLENIDAESALGLTTEGKASTK